MILKTILLILIIILLAVIVTFLYYVFFPSLKKLGNKTDNSIISSEEKNYIKPLEEEIPETTSKALVLCSCKKNFSLEPMIFNQEHTCFMVKNIHGSGTDCKFACIGLGDCTKVCPQQAITVENRTAVVSKLCIGCGKCVDVCPQKIITLVPKTTKTMITCANNVEEEMTSCTSRGVEEKIVWDELKHFKITTYCYKLFKRIKK